MAVLRFVDSIQSSPTVRLDLNDRTIWGMDADTSFGIPPIRRSVSTTMLRDGDHVAASAYGNRELSLVLDLFSTNADTAATQLQVLQRELDREKNILQYTAGGLSNTVFFRTFRTSPDNVRWDINRRQVKVNILAEPFALGLREDIAAITVRNDPTLTNGLFADLTGIKGDVETPLFIEYADGAAGLQRSGFAVGVRWGSSPYPNRFHQAEGFTQLTDASTVADAAFSGGSKSRITFATSAPLGDRLLANFPAAGIPAGAENWGVYRIFARVAQTIAGDVITMACRTDGSYNRTVTIKSQTQPQLVDLGTLDSTLGLPTVGGYGIADYRIEVPASITVAAGRTSGTGSLDVDYVAFVPADECFGSWEAFADVGSTTYLGAADGPNSAVYIATALSGATPGRHAINSSSAVTGRLPRVMPGNNRLVIVETTKGQPAPTSNLLTTSISMTCRYWPRYVSVARPAAT